VAGAGEIANTPAQVPLRALPEALTYRVDLAPAEVLARLRGDADIQIVEGYPARSRTRRRFLAELGPRNFRVCQNLTGGVVDTGPAVMRRMTLEAELVPMPQGTAVQLRFTRGPFARQASFWIMWATSLAWLGLTGITGAKLGLVAMFMALTVPAFIYDLARARGTDEERIELLNLMEHLLGPSLVGENPLENTPYRRPRRLPQATS
jgi:hypothetical protein